MCVCLSCPTLCNPVDHSPPAHAQSCPTRCNHSGKNSRVGCPFLLQGIFPSQGLNPYLLCLLY